jgi:hypothetical protein
MPRSRRLGASTLLGALLVSCHPSPAHDGLPERPEPIRVDYPIPSPIPPDEVRSIAIDYRFLGFHENHLSYRLERGADGRFFTARGRFVSEVSAALFIEAITDLHPSDGFKECTAITDWYPQFRVVLSGAREVIVESRSNCPGYAPWSVIVDGDLFIQYDGKLGPPLTHLLSRIDPQHWSAMPDLPEAYTVIGNGSFALTGVWHHLPEGARRAAPLPEVVYRARLERSAAYRARFAGEELLDLDLDCNLAKNPQCDRVGGRAIASWGPSYSIGFAVDFDGDEVTHLGLDDSVAPTLRRLIASPVFRRLLPPVKPHVTFQVDLQERCSGGLRSDIGLAGSYFTDIRRAIGAPDTARCDVYGIAVGRRDRMPSLDYFPSIERIWVHRDPYTGAFLAELGATRAQVKRALDDVYVLDLDGRLTAIRGPG